jgi:tetratricopeptide (TPR) repeat protein
MESHSPLDSAGGAAFTRITCFLLILFILPRPGFSQSGSPAAGQAAQIKQMYDAGRWSEVVQSLPQQDNENPDLQMYRGLALAKLERWDEAQQAFEAGAARYRRDPRFLVELAGIAYHQKKYPLAERDLRRALALRPEDDYANNFLASTYFLDGNLEAALKYWNRTGQPTPSDLIFNPQPKLRPLVLDRAVKFSPGSEWNRESFLSTEARMNALGLYPHLSFDLLAQPDGSFHVQVYAAEKNGWGRTKWEGAVSLLRGLPYLSVYPEFYNLGWKGLNWRSLVRWDDNKRRIFSELSGPLADDPGIRYRIYFDGRNENWDLTNTLLPANPAPSYLNLEKAVAGAEIQFIPSGRWQWRVGTEYSYRTFRNLVAIPAQVTPFFTQGSSLALYSSVERSLIRFPERRFTLSASASGEFGAFFQNPLGKYGRAEGSLAARWFPQSRGNDYEIQASLKGGATFGRVPFDQFLTMGFERDNDLLLRGHPGLLNGEKGNAPLGRNYVLVNSEMDKIIHRDVLFTVKLGPLLDTGRIYDPSGYFGSRNWLWDTGVQAKIGVLGSFEFVLGYGKDLRTGNNSFFTKVSR